MLNMIRKSSHHYGKVQGWSSYDWLVFFPYMCYTMCKKTTAYKVGCQLSLVYKETACHSAK